MIKFVNSQTPNYYTLVDSLTRYGSLDLWLHGIENFYPSHDQFSVTSIGSSWQFLGPVGLTDQLNGLVSAVYVDTVTDSTLNTIYI